MIDVSIIIPIKNEEKIILYSLNNLKKILLKHKLVENVEILCVINDTNDKTEDLIKKFSTENKNIILKIIHSKPGYGNAMMKGIKYSKGNKIIILNADLIDQNIIILSKYLDKLPYDLILGSKRAPYSVDKRPLLRKIITKYFNLFLKLAFNFRGSDTHGVKLFKKRIAEKILFNKKITNDIVDTYFVLVAEKMGCKILEIPIEVKEIRRSRFVNRFFSTIKDLFNLYQSVKKIKKKRDESFYDTIAPFWDKIMNLRELRKRKQIIFNKLLSGVDLKNKNIIEVGCGIGEIIKELPTYTNKISAIDISSKALTIAKRKVKNCKFKIGSITKIPFTRNYFDITICTEVIEHLKSKQSQEKAIKELKRITKKNGFIVLTTPNKNFRPLFKLLELIGLRPYKGLENWLSISELQKIIKNNNLQIVKEYHFNFIYPSKFFDFFERFQFLSCLMINQGYLIKKNKD